MAKKFLTPIDLNQLELQNARLQNLATAPSSPVKGQVYFNTTSNEALVWNGTAWIPWEVGGVTGVKGNSESTYRTGDVNLTAANIGAAESSHAHGNITSGGDITATAPTIASGDQIIINDHSASKITNGPTFDGSTTTKALTPKGTWETLYSSGTDAELTAGTVTATRVWTPKILHDYIASAIGGADAMRFKGTIGTGGDVTSLPTTGVKIGDTYRVITAGTYAGQACEIGDLIIATATTPTWTVAQTNIDGAITSISGTSPISVTGSGSSRTVSISDATTSASGAMSSSDKTKLNGIATGAEVNQNAFSNVAVSGQTTVAADSKTDTLTLAAGTNITLTTDATNDKVTIGTSAEVNQNAFSNVKVGSTTVAADSKTDTLELVAGTNIALTPDATNDKITIETDPQLLVYETSVTIGTNATSATFTHKEPDKYISDGKMLLDYTAYMNGAEVVVDHTRTSTAVQESGVTQYYNVTETFSVASSPSSAITIKIHCRTWTR